jgi:predicted aspartyl protease
MKMYRLSPVCSLLAALILPASASADAVAQPRMPLASLSLTVEPAGYVDVSVGIVGHDEVFRVATGAFMSELTETLATELRLPRGNLPYREIVTAGGVRVKEYATADPMTFGGFKAQSGKFTIVPDDRISFALAGQLGADILRNYDVEFDFAKSRLNIFSPGQCADAWPGGAAAQLPMDVTGKGQITVSVQLDGKPTTALLDTGYPLSVLSLHAAQAMFGINEQTLELKALRSQNGRAYLLSYPFKSLDFQGVTLAQPDIVIQTTMKQWPDLILGTSVLRELHFCISYDARKLYLARAEAH